MDGQLGYSVKQLAELTPLSELTWRRKIASGEVRAKRVGRRVVVSAEEVRRYLADEPLPGNGTVVRKLKRSK